jgi:hypothetical protein
LKTKGSQSPEVPRSPGAQTRKTSIDRYKQRSASTNLPPGKRARVFFDFQQTDEHELSVSAGETVVIREAEDADWWLVENGSNMLGYIPGMLAHWL